MKPYWKLYWLPGVFLVMAALAWSPRIPWGQTSKEINAWGQADPRTWKGMKLPEKPTLDECEEKLEAIRAYIPNPDCSCFRLWELFYKAEEIK